MSYRISKKSDAVILAELQVICPCVLSFAWVDGEPTFTRDTEAMPDKTKAKLLSYFALGDYLEVVAS